MKDRSSWGVPTGQGGESTAKSVSKWGRHGGTLASILSGISASNSEPGSGSEGGSEENDQSEEAQPEESKDPELAIDEEGRLIEIDPDGSRRVVKPPKETATHTEIPSEIPSLIEGGERHGRILWECLTAPQKHWRER